MIRILLFAFALTTLGCDDHDHAHDAPAQEEHPLTHQVTRWNDGTQLFVEFPVLIKGQQSAFAVHLTTLTDHLPVGEGTVIVILTGADAEPERFEVNKASSPGIFRPIATPMHTGKRQVVIRLQTDAGPQAFDLGTFQVYASEAEAKEKFHDHPPEGIGFSLEEQWRMNFSTHLVHTRDMRPSTDAFARLSLPSDAETIITAPRSGRVLGADAQYPNVGQSVDLGQTLFMVSVGPQEDVDLASLDLDLQQSKIRVDAANREVNRLKPLVSQGIVPQRRLDDALSQLAEARAALQSAERRQGNLGGSQRVTKTKDGLRIPSPLGGTIAELFVSNGEWVKSGQPIARVVNTKRLWLDAAIPEAHVGRVRNIQGAWFNLDGFSETFELDAQSLMSVGSEVNGNTRTLPVRFRLDNADGRLFAGMTTMAQLITDSPQSTLAVPRSALIFDAGSDVIYVQKGGEVFERRVVVKGFQDGDYVQILRGIEPGERIVSTGAHTIKLASVSSDEIGHGHAH